MGVAVLSEGTLRGCGLIKRGDSRSLGGGVYRLCGSLDGSVSLAPSLMKEIRYAGTVRDEFGADELLNP